MNAMKLSIWRIIQSATGKPQYQVAAVQNTTMTVVIASLLLLSILLEEVVKGLVVGGVVLVENAEK